MLNLLKIDGNLPKIEKSNSLYEKIKVLIPSGTHTLAKGVTQYVDGVAPKFLERGKGAIVWDVDGNAFIDYTMAVGPLSLGYSYDVVDNAIKEQLDKGIAFSLLNPLELEVAELVHNVVPNAEMVRFARGGADVTSMAVRLARAYTGKRKILCCGYHGWHDWYVSVTPRNNGVPIEVQNLTNTFEYNNIQSLINSIDEDTAAVILEPVTFFEPKDHFLHQVQEICQKNDVVLIFDEMWTGFRMANGGAQEYFGITPDLATFSKAIANGMPLAVITGKAEILKLIENDVFIYSTFGGEALSLVAAKATINEITEKNVTSYLNQIGGYLKTSLNKILEEIGLDYIKIIGYNFRLMIDINHSTIDNLLIKSFIQQELIRNGILWSTYYNMSYSHTQEIIDYTIEVHKNVFNKLKQVVDNNSLQNELKGNPIQPLFRRVSNFNTKPRI